LRLKIFKKLIAASLNSEFTGSYKKSTVFDIFVDFKLEPDMNSTASKASSVKKKNRAKFAFFL